jgi:hypothetical protein
MYLVPHNVKIVSSSNQLVKVSEAIRFLSFPLPIFEVHYWNK